ncbi:MAG TPA: CPBP family intramembrane glutamic endopeptidase, partial [Terriglobia bacterium]|nr:CPBP family intramembrane glutamic endopeptidase [Terriglobia bacterium]
LSLGAFVALANSHVVRWLRRAASQSVWKALALPLLLLAPYFVEILGAGSFRWQGFLKLIAYLLIPTLLLLPDRTHAVATITWRDCAAMAVLAAPVAAGWMSGIWQSPGGIPFFRPLYSVCSGGYAFLAVRNLQDVGYRLIPRKKDLTYGAANFAGFFIIAIPSGYALDFIHFRVHPVPPVLVAVEFVGTYIMIAVPEEFLFRGILQNLLEKSIQSKRRGGYALIVASVIFGLSHMHHPPVPNWRYAIMATLAGLFYGNAYRDRRRLPASAFTHSLVDVIWHFWF